MCGRLRHAAQSVVEQELIQRKWAPARSSIMGRTQKPLPGIRRESSDCKIPGPVSKDDIPEATMQKMLQAATIGGLLLATGQALAQETTPAPAGPGGGLAAMFSQSTYGIANWIWLLVAAVLIVVVTWFYMNRRGEI
jgi:hypothetical protein